MHDTGCSGLVHWDDPEGRDGEGGGRGVQDGEHITPMADSCQCVAKPIQYCKVKEKKKKRKEYISVPRCFLVGEKLHFSKVA